MLTSEILRQHFQLCSVPTALEEESTLHVCMYVRVYVVESSYRLVVLVDHRQKGISVTRCIVSIKA